MRFGNLIMITRKFRRDAFPKAILLWSLLEIIELACWKLILIPAITKKTSTFFFESFEAGNVTSFSKLDSSMDSNIPFSCDSLNKKLLFPLIVHHPYCLFFSFSAHRKLFLCFLSFETNTCCIILSLFVRLCM